MKILILLLMTIVVVVVPSSTAEQNEKLKPNEVKVCARWMWTGDVFDRKVYCVEWVIKDCSNRLYVDICKRGN